MKVNTSRIDSKKFKNEQNNLTDALLYIYTYKDGINKLIYSKIQMEK